VVLEEADETVFWLEALTEAGAVKPALLAPLLQEANELVAIFCRISAHGTVKSPFTAQISR